MDDARIGQGGGNQPEIKKIDWRLVDLARPAIGSQVRAIALTQCSEIKLR